MASGGEGLFYAGQGIPAGASFERAMRHAANRRAIDVLLVVDSDRDARALSALATESRRYTVTVTVARSIKAAGKHLKAGDFDLLMCDFWIGNQTCVPLLDMRCSAGRDRPVVVLSNLPDAEIEAFAGPCRSFSVLTRSALSLDNFDRAIARAVDAELPRQETTPKPVGDPTFGTVAITDRLKSVIRAMDTVHANSTVAKGALGQSDLASADTFLSASIESASTLRRDLFRMVADLRMEMALAHSPTGAVNAVEIIGSVLDLFAYDPAGAARPIDFVKPDVPIWLYAGGRELMAVADLLTGYCLSHCRTADRLRIGLSLERGALILALNAPVEPSLPAPIAEELSPHLRALSAEFESAADGDAARFLVSIPLRPTRA